MSIPVAAAQARRAFEIDRLMREYEGRSRNLSEMLRIDRERAAIAHARVVGEVGRICAALDQMRALGVDVKALLTSRATP